MTANIYAINIVLLWSLPNNIFFEHLNFLLHINTINKFNSIEYILDYLSKLTPRKLCQYFLNQ